MNLGPLPPGFAATRDALHRVAAERISPARKAATGHIDLRATPGGFGTAPFGDGVVVRVEGDELVLADGTRERLDGVDDAAARWLGAFYGLALDCLTELAAELEDPTPPKLWPEHFDYAIEAGEVRANYGFSPGDETYPEPYVYVGPWEARPTGPLWDAQGFPGAVLELGDLLAQADRRAAALAFLRERAAALRV